MTRDEEALRYSRWKYENDPDYRKAVDPIIKAWSKVIRDEIDKEVLKDIIKKEN